MKIHLFKKLKKEGQSMKLVIVGGGSSYTPELIEGVILHRDSLPVTEIVLVDVPMGLKKVEITTTFAKRMIARAARCSMWKKWRRCVTAF